MSDSHDHLDMIHQAVDLANQRRCDTLLLLGDLVSPFAMLAYKAFTGQIYGVYGNNDGDRLRLQQSANSIGADFSADPRSLELGGRRFFMMHEPFLLDEAAQSGRYDYILYGHLHRVDQRVVENCMILSPGELGGWLGASTFAILNTTDGEVETLTLEKKR